ncbi:MAG: hypothetical protein JWN13_2250 [Betaproteobacteria bacterium]|nr:hypothetical protein [Betaproteobacteria bacterium]
MARGANVRKGRGAVIAEGEFEGPVVADCGMSPTSVGDPSGFLC